MAVSFKQLVEYLVLRIVDIMTDVYLVICRIFCEELAKCKGNPSEVGRVFKKRVCSLLSLLKSKTSGLSVYRYVTEKKFSLYF